MQHGRNDGAAVLQRLHDMLLRGAQSVKVGAAAKRPRAQQDLRQRRRVRQALQHAVHEAGVPQVLQPRALQICRSISSHSVKHGLPQDAAAAAAQQACAQQHLCHKRHVHRPLRRAFHEACIAWRCSRASCVASGLSL